MSDGNTELMMANGSEPRKEDSEEYEVAFTGNVTLVIDEAIEHVVKDGEIIDARLWELAGAFDGSTITVSLEETATVWGDFHAFVLTVHHDILLEKPMVRKILDIDGEDSISVIDNVEFYIRKHFQGQGIGKTSLYVEALAAHELGFNKIVANAANPPDAGWVVWPKLGYDAPVDGDILEKISDDLSAAGLELDRPLMISDLIDNGLFHLWERDGQGCIMEFDVSSLHSWSMTRIAHVYSKED